jgi:hypothetical protein
LPFAAAGIPPNYNIKPVLILGSARLGAVVGLGMLPIMDSIHRQHKAYTDMKVRGLVFYSWYKRAYFYHHEAAKHRIERKRQAIPD